MTNLIKKIFQSDNKYCHKNESILLSSMFLFLVPLGYAIFNLPEEYLLISLIFLMGLFSVLADYYYLDNETINILDRMSATVLVIYIGYRCHSINLIKTINLINLSN